MSSLSLSQGRQLNFYRIDAVKQVLPKSIRVGQIPFRRLVAEMSRTSIGSGFSAPTGDNLASLERREQFALQMQRDIADLVEKQRAASRRAKKADAILRVVKAPRRCPKSSLSKS